MSQSDQAAERPPDASKRASLRLAELQARHPRLEFRSFSACIEQGELRIEHEFVLDGGPTFRPSLRVPCEACAALSGAALRTLAFHHGLIELISYWKAACSPQIDILCGALSTAQIVWWKRLYYRGLGEFFFRNGLNPDPEHCVEIVTRGPSHAPLKGPDNDRILVPLGGGKDSLVTLDVLRPWHDRVAPFALNASPAMRRSAAVFGLEGRLIEARRTIDPALLELNAQGYFNGHTPFSALLAFTATLVAAAHGIGWIALSNESSANESTVPGTDINHQYSKTLEFERAFQHYAAAYLAPHVRYFSLLRPWTELRIARQFAALPEAAHRAFRSCNAASKQDLWCGRCPKCLFVAVILRPFLPWDRQRTFFPLDPLDQIDLAPVLDQLAGVAPHKPFECVGTAEEVRAALSLALERCPAPEAAPALLRRFTTEFPHLRLSPEDAAELGRAWAPEHEVPETFAALLRAADAGL